MHQDGPEIYVTIQVICIKDRKSTIKSGIIISLDTTIGVTTTSTTPIAPIGGLQPCAQNDCLNGGTCYIAPGGGSTCNCATGYTGRKCETLGNFIIRNNFQIFLYIFFSF